MKKVLILTTSTGQGHNQAAKSLMDSFSKQGYECIRYDFLGYNSNIVKNIITKGYEISASKLPHIYGLIYKYSDIKSIHSFLNIVFNKSTKKINDQIQKVKPDIIIGTHPLSVNIICNLKKKGLNIPFISVVTDFKAHYTYVNDLVDTYITASDFTKQSLIERNINPNIIYPLGIPIKESFYDFDDNIPLIKQKNYFNLLLMSGSMGLSNISYVVDELLKNPNNLRITVVCGNNKKLEQSLQKKSKEIYNNKILHILGFSNDIASLMEYSDILISKPGGLTVTEAMVKNLPLIIPFAIPGQESENVEFLTETGIAYYVPDLSKLNQTVNTLIENPSLISEMKNNLKNVVSKYSLDRIVTIANDLIEKDN